MYMTCTRGACVHVRYDVHTCSMSLMYTAVCHVSPASTTGRSQLLQRPPRLRAVAASFAALTTSFIMP